MNARPSWVFFVCKKQQYQVKIALLTNLRPLDSSLLQATQSALRHVVGGSEMHSVLTEGRALLALDIESRLQALLDEYRTGLEVIKVNIENTAAPSQVQDAFDDVIKAREDEQRVKNEAQAYANGSYQNSIVWVSSLKGKEICNICRSCSYIWSINMICWNQKHRETGKPYCS